MRSTERTTHAPRNPAWDPGRRPCHLSAVIVSLGIVLMGIPAAEANQRTHGPAHRKAHHADRRHHRTKTWYVRAGAAPGKRGTRRAPFSTLAQVERASRAGDTIVILASSAHLPPLAGGIRLKPRQTLRGAGPPVVRALTPALLPRIENLNRSRHHGDAIELADGDTVANLVIGPAYRGGIYGSELTKATVLGNDVSHTNTSCATGFVVQPFKLPGLVPGTGVPFSSGLPNGWAAIMVDESHSHASLRIAGNRVHDAACADGIDVRASGTAHLRAVVTGNRLTRLQEGPSQQSVLAIGMQSIGNSTLDARLSSNTETYIGSATAGDQGFADSEGLFANSAGPSRLTEHVDRNTFAHGLGHLSANCLEVVSSNGAPKMDVTLTRSSCEYVVGDILEAVNLSQDAQMRLSIDRVRAEHSEFTAGPAFHQVEPGDDGDCLFELGAGAGSTTSVRVTHSRLAGCITDGLEAAASVDDGTGPVRKLSFDVQDSQITGNTLSNIRVANSSPVSELDGRVARSDLSTSPGTPIILENLDRTDGTHARFDFGGGSLGSPGGNCIYGGGQADITDARSVLSARYAWWGRPGGPAPARTVVAGGALDSSDPLGRAPAATC